MNIINYHATWQSLNFPPKLENPPKLGVVLEVVLGIRT